MAELKLSLANPGMSDLHKVGLGGLYMTLKSLDLKKKKIKGLEYTFDKRNIVLHFEDNILGKSIAELIQYSFQIDKTGFFHFPALELNGVQPLENKLISHKGIINSFYQHGSHRSKKDITLNLSKETDRPNIINKFPKLSSYVIQYPKKYLLNTNGSFKEKIDVIGWMYLGGSEKHAALSGTKLSERIETAFPLLFGCIGCIYLSIKIFDPHLRKKIKTCIVIPSINDLESFASNRAQLAQFKELEITMAGLTEAALFISEKFYVEQNISIKKFLSITIVSFGDTKWNKQQKSKTSLHKYKIDDIKTIHNYSIIAKILKPQYQISKEEKDKRGKIKKPENSYVRIPISKELFCENIANGKPFYIDFHKLTVPIKDSSGKLMYKIKFEQKELNEVVEKINYDYEGEKIFIKACHTAWKHRLGKLGSDSKKPGAGSFEKLVARDFERLRVALSKSKNLESFRETITDFWSRAGRIQELTDGWEKAMILLELENWKKGRDLALLALVSYKPKNKEEETALKKFEFDDNKGEEDE
ncbi:type I-MYXAN CRISPR-associated Cas8a1/Cmx1 [Leptospira kirschneri]|uniref:type I-MYXAN CRISPR-associated Cas8a1/Cmx1 n=1 Tax=Leptospira kirschneri TaxID=29507 RepID=UPI003563E1C2